MNRIVVAKTAISFLVMRAVFLNFAFLNLSNSSNASFRSCVFLNGTARLRPVLAKATMQDIATIPVTVVVVVAIFAVFTDGDPNSVIGITSRLRINGENELFFGESDVDGSKVGDAIG